MYTLIDCTNKMAIAVHAEYRALTALAYVQFANVDTVVMPLSENRSFAQFDADELNKIADGAMLSTSSVTGRVPGVQKTREYTYGDLIARCRAIIEAADHLRLPLPADNLEKQAEAIDADDDRPYVIAVDGSTRPRRADKWTNPPQRNRPRVGPSGEAPQFRQFPARGMPKPSATLEKPLTAKADGVPYSAFIAEGWTDELLIEHGYMLPAKTVPKMTDKAGDVPYESFIEAGWTDAQLIAHGYMVA